MQHVDVRDLGEWTINLCEDEATGAYNATGPDTPHTLTEFFEVCRLVTGSDAEFTWVPDDLLLKHDVQPFREIPFWLPAAQQESLMTMDVSKAIDAGLTFRPIEDTIQDTLDWVDSMENPPGDAGLSPEREQALLQTYHAQSDDISGE
jgi:2'-hydroxyisoflavone reductase